MKLLFMGTPAFAVPCLAQLYQDGHELLGVFTQPDKPKGRHYTLTPPPVKELALSHGTPVFQPATLRNEAVEQQIRALAPQCIVVVAYGKLLPPRVLEIPPHGCINIHASLLPKLRGAAPIQWAVLRGEAVTGVTAMQMDAGLDTGDMLLARETPIEENETAGELQQRLSVLGAAVLHDTLVQLEQGTLQPQKQDDALFTYAPLLDKSLSPVNWANEARQIHNQIRGLSPWPGAVTQYGGKTVKLHAARMAEGFAGFPGEIRVTGARLLVCCGNNTAIELLEMQLEGKKRMPTAQFLAGNPLTSGTGFLSTVNG